MLIFKYSVAILIVVAGMIGSGFLYWFLTKKFIRFHAKIWYGLDFKEMAKGEGVKITENERKYLKKYLLKMLICGLVLGLGSLIIVLTHADLTYFKLYPLKMIFTKPELLEASNLKAMIGCLFMFVGGFMIYPYKGLIFTFFSFGKGGITTVDDYDN